MFSHSRLQWSQCKPKCEQVVNDDTGMHKSSAPDAEMISNTNDFFLM